MPMPEILFRPLDPEKNADIALPRYMSAQAAGMDIQAAPPAAVTISPGEIAVIPTGFSMALPEGLEAQIRPRSGLVIKHGVTVVNSPGTIDADYRGEVRVGLINLGQQPYTIKRGDRIAQMVIHKVMRLPLKAVTELDDTARGSGGFGHTGV